MTYLRDQAMNAVILGFFASAWFGWAQEKPPARWRTPLTIGSCLSLAVAVLGGILAWRHWSDGSAFSDPDTSRRYGILVGVEFGIAGVGAGLLALRRRTEFIAPWICLVVGLHFLPMAAVLASPAYVPLGVVLTAVAVTAVFVARRTGLAPSAITGAGAGATLLGFAVAGAISAFS